MFFSIFSIDITHLTEDSNYWLSMRPSVQIIFDTPSFACANNYSVLCAV